MERKEAGGCVPRIIVAITNEIVQLSSKVGTCCSLESKGSALGTGHWHCNTGTVTHWLWRGQPTLRKKVCMLQSVHASKCPFEKREVASKNNPQIRQPVIQTRRKWPRKAKVKVPLRDCENISRKHPFSARSSN